MITEGVKVITEGAKVITENVEKYGINRCAGMVQRRSVGVYKYLKYYRYYSGRGLVSQPLFRPRFRTN